MGRDLRQGSRSWEFQRSLQRVGSTHLRADRRVEEIGPKANIVERDK